MEELPENNVKHLFIGCDHTSLSQKLNILDMLKTKYKHINIIDMGCHNTKSCNYTDIAHNTCQQFLLTKDARIILMCGTGTGMSIVANRYKGIRCAYGHTISQVMMARQHNDVNALALGVQVLELSDMRGMVQAFLETEFTRKDYNGHLTRHSIRVTKIDNDVKYLNNKIEDGGVKEFETEMPFKSNAVRDVVHTDIFKPENKKKVRMLSTQKSDKLHPINLKVNMVPFEKRNPSLEFGSYNESSGSPYVKTLPSHLSNSDSLKVNYDEDDIFVKHNEEVNQVFTKIINTHDTTQTEKNQLSNVSVISDFILNKKENETETNTYLPSNGNPKRKLEQSGDEVNEVNDVNDHGDDVNDVNDHGDEANEVKDHGDEVNEVNDHGDNVNDHSDNVNDHDDDVNDVNDHGDNVNDVNDHGDEGLTSVYIEEYNEVPKPPVVNNVLKDKVETEALNKSSVNIDKNVSKERSKMVLQIEKNHILNKLKELKIQENNGNTSETRLGGYDAKLHYIDVDEIVTNDDEDNIFNDEDIDVDKVILEYNLKNNTKQELTHLSGVDGNRLFQEHNLERDVPFLKNKVTQKIGSRSFQNKSINSSNNKIELLSRNFTADITTINMSNHLEYPDTINTDNTLLPVMANYAQNCSEAAKLEEDIMRKIVELRERVRLIYRDLNAEMGTVFNLNDTTQ
jgi:ribose 5-phosphate isomerase B